MKYVYRICKRKFATLEGDGARLFGGRWNAIGTPALYVAETLSLAALEILVHADPRNFPTNLVWLQISLPASTGVDDKTALGIPDLAFSQKKGTAWLNSQQNLALRVTSAVMRVPEIEANIVLNPSHRSFSSVKIVKMGNFEFDSRFSV